MSKRRALKFLSYILPCRGSWSEISFYKRYSSPMHAGICAEGSMSERRLWQSLSYTTLYTSSRGRWSLKVVQVRKHLGSYSWTITWKEGLQNPRDRIWAIREGWIEMAFVGLPETSSAEIASTANSLLWNVISIGFLFKWMKSDCAHPCEICGKMNSIPAVEIEWWKDSFYTRSTFRVGIEWYGATETFPAAGPP